MRMNIRWKTVVSIGLVGLLLLITVLFLQSHRKSVAVLDLRNRVGLQVGDVDTATDLVRKAARSVLPRSKYTVMTKEKIAKLLPPVWNFSDCAGPCALETGRKVGADYVVDGEIVKAAGQLRVALAIRDTMEGNLLANRNAGAAKPADLEDSIGQAGRELFSILPGATVASTMEDSSNRSPAPPPPSYQPGSESRIEKNQAGSEKRIITEETRQDKLKLAGAPGGFVLIQPGTFTMGSPTDMLDQDEDESQHRVTLTKSYYLARKEVTVAEFKRFVDATGHRTQAEKQGWCNAFPGGKLEKAFGTSWRNPGYPQEKDHPAVCISWNDAVAFANWRTAKEGLTRCYIRRGSETRWDLGCTGYRLPTEAEWEYAARAGTTTAYYTGNCLSTDEANYDGKFSREGCSKGVSRGKTMSVGSLSPNPWGLYEMHGNVWEWCWDWYRKDYPSGPVTDPVGADSGSSRIHRGCSWNSHGQQCRSAQRSSAGPDACDYDLGIRLVRPAE